LTVALNPEVCMLIAFGTQCALLGRPARVEALLANAKFERWWIDEDLPSSEITKGSAMQQSARLVAECDESVK